MVNSQPMKIKKGSGSKADTSEGLTQPQDLAHMVAAAFSNSSKTTTATTLKGLRKTWTNAELSVLRSKAGLVAGALADFQAAGGLVVVRKVKVNEKIQYPKIILVAGGISININETVDGIEFDLVAV